MHSHPQPITVTVSALVVDPFTNLPSVLLEDEYGRTVASVPVAADVAANIAAELAGIEFERPLSHHLTVALIERAGAAIDRVELTESCGDTYAAAVFICLPSGPIVAQEARATDAIAIGLHTGVDIWIAWALGERATFPGRVSAPISFADGSGEWRPPALDRSGSPERAELHVSRGADVISNKWKN